MASRRQDAGGPNVGTQDSFPRAELEKVKADEREAENCLWVCLYVIADILGISGKDLREAFQQIIVKGTFYTVAVRLGNAAKKGQWSSVAFYAKQLFTFLFGEDTLKKLRKALGDEACEKLLKKAGSRFLPWVGPALLASDVIYALWNNWDAIKNCISEDAEG